MSDVETAIRCLGSWADGGHPGPYSVTEQARIVLSELSRLQAAKGESFSDLQENEASLFDTPEKVAGLIAAKDRWHERAQAAEARIAAIGRRARGDGNRTFDDTIRDLMWIDDECRRAGTNNNV
jgi:hypothetical protein